MRVSELPERILVYHPGVGKIAFVGCMKVTACFLFAANLALAGPTAIGRTQDPAWNALAGMSITLSMVLMLNPVQGIALGAIPMIFVSRTAAPFVAFVHIRPPLWARRSRRDLMRFFSAGGIPPSTEVDLTTIGALGRSRVSRIPFGELWPTRSRFGIQNIVRKSDNDTTIKRPWWRGKDKNFFYVSETSKKTLDSVSWQRFYGQIQAKAKINQ